MVEIKDLLKRFDVLINNKEFQFVLIQETLKEILKIEISKNQIKINGNDVYLDIKPIYKNEIFLNKEKIISLLKEKSLNKKDLNIF